MSARAAAAALLLGLALLRDPARAADTEIADLDEEEFSFGSMAIGQAKDVDWARAEGLGLVPPTPLDLYLNGILHKLLAQSPVKNVPARAYLRASGDWAAKTTADANVYVTLGTLLRLDSEDEVAALLAHEASHVLLGHADADVVQSLQQRAIQLSALAGEAHAMIAGEDAPAAGSKPTQDAARVEEQSRALLLNTLLVVPAWTRAQEADADRLGTDLLVRAGYSPAAMASLLKKQKSFESERARNPQMKGLDQQLFGVDLNLKVQEQTQKAAKSLGLSDPGVGELAGGALGKVFEWGAKKVDETQRSHPKTEERIEEIEVYARRAYPAEAGRTPQVQPWEAAKEQDGTVDVLENYIAAIEANGKLSEGDVATARRLAKNALTGPTRAHAYPNYVDAAVQLAAGTPDPALADYQTALAGPEPAGAIYSEASVLYLESGKRAEAVEVLEGGYARLQQPPSLTIPLIRTYRLVGRQADAERLAAECAVRWPKMQPLCSEEARGGAGR